MQGKIIKSIIDSISPASKDQFLWDIQIPGFGLKVTPSGRKVYILQYRIGGGNTYLKRYTIGTHGDLTPDQARKEALRLKGQIASGLDPAEAKKKERAALPFKDFSTRYLAEYAELHKKPRSIQEDRRNLDNHVLLSLGNKPLEKIGRADIAKLHHGLRESPIAANRTLSLLTTMFNLSERWGLRPDGSNPCRHIQRYKETRRERFLSSEELSRLGQALAKVEEDKTYSPFLVAVIRLLIFTGARLGEILSLKWEDVDFQGRRLILADSKTGKKVIQLNAPALAVLDQLPRIEENPYVCCGQRLGKGLVNIHRGWFDIRDQAGLPDVRLHDLRHSFASVAASAGTSLYVIGSLLGHTQPSTTARYAHLHQDPLREASEAIAQRIHAAMNPASEKGEVISIPKSLRKKAQ